MTESALKKLQWASRRGMLELDVVLLPYLDKKGTSFTEQQLGHYSQFLEETDPDLYAWIMGFEQPKPEYKVLVDDIKQFIDDQLQK